MKKDQINSLVDSVAALFKIGLGHLADEMAAGAETLREHTREAPAAGYARQSSLDLDNLLNTQRFDSTMQAFYRIVAIRPAEAGAPEDSAQVRIQFPDGWYQVRTLGDVLKDTPLAG